MRVFAVSLLSVKTVTKITYYHGQKGLLDGLIASLL